MDGNMESNFQKEPKGYLAPTLSSLSRSSSVRDVSVKVNSRADLCGPSLPKENSSSAVHLKKSPSAAVEKNKRLRSSVVNTCVKSSGRAKKMDQHLSESDKICGAMPSKMQVPQWSDVLTSEELSNGPPLKTGSQMDRNPSDTGSQRFDNRPKSVVLSRNPSDTGSQRLDNPPMTFVLNKRTRTSVAEARAESKNKGDIVEEKVRRLPIGGESLVWKMKRSRFGNDGSVISRSVGDGGEPKQNMHHKLTMESTLHASGSTHGFRPSNHEENRVAVFNQVVKGKASRPPRSVSITSYNSAAANVPLLSGTMERREPPHSNKTPAVGGPNSSKHPMLAQWGGQRPHKISRTRKTDIDTLSNQDEIHVPLKKRSDHRGFNGEPYDHEELLIAANLACSSSFKACSSSLMKTNDELFSPVDPDKKLYLSEQLKFAEESCAILSQTNAAQLELDGHQIRRMRMSGSSSCQRSESMENIEFEQSQTHELTSANPIYIRLLSAIIEEDVETKESEGNGLVTPSGSFGDSFISDSENELMDSLGVGEPNFEYGEMPLEEKLLVELNSLGIFLEDVGSLDNKDDGTIGQQIGQLQRRLYETVDIKKTGLEKIQKAVEGENIARDLPEKVAMDKLVEVAHKKLVATEGSFASKIPRVPKKATAGFTERTLARCQKFEESGVSCFSESPLREIIYAAPSNAVEAPIQPYVTVVGNAVEAPIHSSVEKNVVEPLRILGSGGIKKKKRTTLKKKKKAGQPSKLPNATDAPKESKELAKLPVNSIEELGADPEITAGNNFDDLFSLDMLGVQDYDGNGLDIPIDNLTDIF